LVPDTVWGGLSILRACRIHDYDWAVGTDRGIADKRFHSNMLLIVEACTRWNWLKRLRIHQADTYYWAVAYKGDAFYNKSRGLFDMPIEMRIHLVSPGLFASARREANDPNNTGWQLM